MTNLLADIRYAIRLLVKERTFTVTALLTLAICIAANTTMFSIVRSVLFSPLPFPGSDQVVLLYNSYPEAGAPRVGAAVPDYFDRQASVPALAELALFRSEGITLGDNTGAERLRVLRAMPSFFPLVQAQPAAGRVFTEAEGEPGADTKAILSYGFWQRKYGGNPSVVGQTIRLNGTLHDVVGVMPGDFVFLDDEVDIFLPAAFTADDKSDDRRHSNNWQMVGRLAPGATLGQVQAQVTALNAANNERFPEFAQILKDAKFETVAVMLRDDVVADIRPVLYLLWGGVLFVLLIGGMNIANLVIVRSTSRVREMATRHAIGGDLRRLARQVLTETMVLSVAGGICGLVLGAWATSSISALNIDALPRGHEVAMDVTTVLVVLGLAMVVGLLLGVAPALRLWRMNLNAELREETRGGTSGRRGNRARRALATVQVAVALVLLVGAGLLLSSFRAVLNLDFGFDPTGVSTASVNLPAATYGNAEARAQFASRALDAIRAIPGVDAAGTTTMIPFGDNTSNSVILAEGRALEPGESLLAPANAVVSDEYFEAMSIDLVAGRAFNAGDTPESTRVAVIDQRLADRFWPGREAVGRRLYEPDDPGDLTRITDNTTFYLVVGVVETIQASDPRADVAPVGTYYFPASQRPRSSFAFAVKATSRDGAVMGDVRRALSAIDPELPLYSVRTMQEWIDRALVTRRVPMLIAMVFSAIAAFLAAVGIYGVLAFGVAQRERELGVRMALGGSGASVFRVVLTEGVHIVALGLFVGLAGAYGVGQIMRGQLFGVAPMDLLVLSTVIGVLVVASLVASTLPAWRASRINPIVVLGR